MDEYVCRHAAGQLRPGVLETIPNPKIALQPSSSENFVQGLPLPSVLATFKTTRGQIKGVFGFGVRADGARLSSSPGAGQSDEQFARDAGSCNPIPDREAGIRPREYLCVTTAYSGSVIAPKRAKSSRYSDQGAFYPGS